MLLLWLFLPLLCSMLIWVLPLFLQKKNSFLLIAHLYLITIFFWVYFFYTICYKQIYYYINIGPWISCGLLYIPWGLQIDSITIIMLGLVSIVSTAVHFFSLNYMANDSSLIRFFSLLSLFTFFMYILISGDNLLVLFLGWEGIGICSFLLISFWHTRISATKSALKAIILNRVGDSAYIAAVAFIFLIFKTLDFSVIFALSPIVSDLHFLILNTRISYLETISILLVIGAIGKSAQLGLHGWLPEAMEGPTPVSALIHAATLVTAGIFLIIRCSAIIEYAPFTLNIILILGGLTCVFGSMVACAQNDIKRIIAFSTTSQLGYMFFACGLSAYNVALFHLLNHGFFKALLFLCAGAVIHSIYHEQDIRKLGGLIIFIPFVYSSFLISLLALIGFPFLSGFFSKEIIIELSFTTYTLNSFFIAWVGTISACLTAFYGTRCLYLTFLSSNNSPKIFIQNIANIGNGILFALTILIMGSIFSGLFFKDILIGLGTNYFGNSIYFSSHHVLLDFEYISWYIKILPLVGTIVFLILAIFLNKIMYIWFNKNKHVVYLNKTHYLPKYVYLLNKIKTLLNNKLYLDYIINNYFGIFVLKHSYETFYKIIDKGILEIFIVNGLSFSFLKLSRNYIKQQNGFVFSHLCSVVLAIIFSILIFTIL